MVLTVEGLQSGRPTVTHHRIDADHSNSYEAWKKLGSPQEITPAQYAALEKAAALTTLGAATRETVEAGRLELSFALPRQAVSLVTIEYD